MDRPGNVHQQLPISWWAMGIFPSNPKPARKCHVLRIAFRAHLSIRFTRGKITFRSRTFQYIIFQLWRCWVIWKSSGRLVAYAVIALPTIVLLASFVLGTIWTLQSSQPGLSLYNSLPVAFGTAYYVSSLGVNILVTILITIRLVFHRYSIVPPDHAVHHPSITAIIVESAALYSVFGLCFIVSYTINNPMNQIFMALASLCQQIAGYLIILRLAQGRAWDSSTPAKNLTTEPQLTTVACSVPTSSTQPGADQGPPDVEAQTDSCLSKRIKSSNARGVRYE
ncbi:hypothetical protein AX14_007138 [Amanita brunnescens Koide BX004]|nr:hypothetical protein AX14_007138 [Amanita brunnescens Koide BX004]